MLVLVNGARRTFSAKDGEGRKDFFARLNLRAAKKRKRQSYVRKTLRTYPMETLATQAIYTTVMPLSQVSTGGHENSGILESQITSGFNLA